MSLFALYHAGKAPTRQEIVDHIAGNLCRCTGYRPIVDAAARACTGKRARPLGQRPRTETAAEAGEAAGRNRCVLRIG